MAKFKSTKLIELGSCAFRQPNATSHCKNIHGYQLTAKVWLEANELDERNWVFDFGGMKRAKTTIGGMTPKEFFAHMLDHTTIVAKDDPYLETFEKMDEDGIIQLRLMDSVGCEQFAKYLYDIINTFNIDIV